MALKYLSGECQLETRFGIDQYTGETYENTPCRFKTVIRYDYLTKALGLTGDGVLRYRDLLYKTITEQLDTGTCSKVLTALSDSDVHFKNLVVHAQVLADVRGCSTILEAVRYEVLDRIRPEREKVLKSLQGAGMQLLIDEKLYIYVALDSGELLPNIPHRPEVLPCRK